MPLPSDEKLIALSEALIAEFDAIFGLHPGFRPAHAKGALLTGTFTPTSEAKQLSTAPHFARESTPVTVRFSNSTGIPLIPDNDPNGSPKGMAIRFHLAERVHTDIIVHSTDGFPTHTGAEFLEFLKAIAGERAGCSFAEAGGVVCREPSGGAGVCADTEACSGKFCDGRILWGDGDGVRECRGSKPVYAVSNCAGGRAGSSG